MEILKQSVQELLENLPTSSLFDLARNDSAQYPVRKAAVALLIAKSDPRAQHPDLQSLVYEIAAETLGGSSPSSETQRVESGVVNRELPPIGPFRASVTTETMFRDEAEHREELKREANQGFYGPHDPEVPLPKSRLSPSKPLLPQQPVVSIDVPDLEPLPVVSPAPALYKPGKK